MRVGILNFYWNTRGGGERHAGAIAEVLSLENDVELIGCEPVDVQGLADALGLDLSRTTYRQAESPDSYYLSALSRDYDLFINSTFASNLVSQARRSAYLVFFPQRLLSQARLQALSSAAAFLERRLAPQPEPLAGFYEPEGEGPRWIWSQGKAVIRLPSNAFRDGRADVRFVKKGPLSLAQSLRSVQGDSIRWRTKGSLLILETRKKVTRPVEIELECETFQPKLCGLGSDSRHLGLCLELADSRGPWQTHTARRLINRLDRHLRRHDRSFLASYDVFMANSKYTQRWVKHRWNRDSRVLPPPFDTRAFLAPAPHDKDRVILSVGRFFAGNHNKKHVEMVKVFRRLCDRGLIPAGWEYHIVGNVHRSTLADLEYYADVERLVRGYPIKLLPDLPFSDLLEEYGRAAIFWHAAGWGESDRRHPEKLEHFGLTTCEAMSSGCIPVVIGKAGQLEIVVDGKNGFLFRNRSELIDRTARLVRAHGEPWTLTMRRAAIDSVQRFGNATFERNLLAILELHLTSHAQSILSSPPAR